MPQAAFTPADIVELYLHRGAFETVLWEEDREQDPDRWVSHTACGQEFWQILSQWMWNLRLELGQHLQASPLRTTLFSPAHLTPQAPAAPLPAPVPTGGELAVSLYGPPQFAKAAPMGGFAGVAFAPQPDGTLRCPADQPLYLQERRPARDGSVRVLYAARRRSCRACALRAQCLGYGTATQQPRRVSAVLWPLAASASSHAEPAPLVSPVPALAVEHPLLWRDRPRSETRRAWTRLLQTQTVTILLLAAPDAPPPEGREQVWLTRAQRAHWRLSWTQRLARNASSCGSSCFQVHLFGIPPALAALLGLDST